METFGHIKTVLSIILGLSITHVLKGNVKLIEHPGKYKPYWIHLLWGLYLFLLLIHFWWWEIYLNNIKTWVFSQYFFLILYSTMYYVLCVLLFPDDIKDYPDYKTYFYSRRKWFFGMLAVTFAADFVDTLLKGKEYLAHLHWEYPVRNITHVVLCLLAIKISKPKFHAALIIILLAYELSWILRLYNT